MDKIIEAGDKTIRELLADVRSSGSYTVDDYQREYKWDTKQVGELIDDLFAAFGKFYNKSHAPTDVKGYGGYYLGSVILSERNIVDGQQRLTSLTLLLIRLRHLSSDEGLRAQLAALIYSDSFGEKSFNIDVEERNDCLNVLCTSGEPGEAHRNSEDESVRNLAKRYDDITDKLGGKSDKELELFSYWLTGKVLLVRIGTSSKSNAYEVFETTNDRGLRLTSVDMLKNFLLSKVGNAERASVVAQWKKSVGGLINYAQKDGQEEDSDAIKAWLRARHAKTMRKRDKDAEPEDFEQIGTFHRWVRKNSQIIGLSIASDFVRFVKRDMAFYLGWYLNIRKAADKFNSELECVYYNAENDFTLQYPVLLSVLSPDDGDEAVVRKLRIVSRYLDILLYRRIMRWDAVTRSTLEYTMYNLILDIRGKSEDELLQCLREKLAKDKDATPDKNYRWYRNRDKVRSVLARITHHITTEAGGVSNYAEYRPYDIEHIWPDDYEKLKAEFDDKEDFDYLRNHLGGLLLLPKKVNRSLSDKPYPKKLEVYLRENLLAASLHPKCYQNNPGFSQFKEKSGLPFKPHAEFKKEDLQERQELYLQIAEQIWNPDRLAE